MSIHSYKTRYVLLDRDGVINRRNPSGYVTSWEQFEFLPRALESLQMFWRHGVVVLVVSNQACVGKGLMSLDQLQSLTQRFVSEVAANGGNIRTVYYCPHVEERKCACRKPEAGLLFQAQREHGFDFGETFVVGDSKSDLEAAESVGAPSVLVSESKTPLTGPYPACAATVNDLYEAAELIIGVLPMELQTIATPSGATPVPFSRSKFQNEN